MAEKASLSCESSKEKERSHTPNIKFQLIGYFNKQSNNPSHPQSSEYLNSRDARLKTLNLNLNLNTMYCMHAFLHFTTVWLLSSPLPCPSSTM